MPLATAEGALVTSYYRGMHVLGDLARRDDLVEDGIRARLFIFDDALEAREFGDWIDQHEEGIQRPRRQQRARASSSTSGSTRFVHCSIYESTSRRATPPVRT